MKQTNRWHSILALAIVGCMLALPMSAYAKKGKDHYNKGIDFERTQQWEKAAQEFTLALAEDPANIDYQLHYRRAVFNASQMFMQQGRSLAEQRDYVGAYNAFRQAFGYDPVNQLATSEMERMLRLEQVKEGNTASVTTNDGAASPDALGGGTPAQPSTRSQEPEFQPKPEAVRNITFNGVDIRQVIKSLASDLNLNVMFDRQTFAQPRPVDLNLRDVTSARALDFLFLQEGLFFQKLDKRTILVADQARRPQYQQLVVRTFFIANSDPDKIKQLIAQALPPSVGRPQPIVVPDKDTNSLTVRDTAENVNLIGELLQSLDKDRAEVVMDIDIYEVNHSDLLQLGNQLGTASGFTLGGSPGLSVLTNNGVVNGTQRGINLASVVGAVPTGAAAALVIPPSVLNAFQSKNNSRLLASTQIHAFNNEESSARIGQRVPVQTAQAYPFGVQTTATTPTAQQPFGSGGFPVINYEPTGLTLKFQPIVFPNLDVQVKMNIESKDVTGANTLTPTFTERTISGTARVQNNRTMMLANVSTDVQSNGRAGLPVLSGLPILGRLFTSPTKDNRRVDIVIAVTPRVLRAPALTPRDEEMRPSGTLQAPTTGSLEAMLRETEREEQIAAARRLPKDAEIRLPDQSVTYQAGVKSDALAQTKVVESQIVPANAATNTPAQSQNVSASQTPANGDGNRVTAALQSDASMPQPKSASAAATEAPVKQTVDVASALKNVVSAPTNVSTTGLTAKQDSAVVPIADVAPKPDLSVNTASASEAKPAVMEVSLTPEKTELKIGDKQQLQVRVKSDAPLGMALMTLRFDPKVLKIDSISMGDLFANVKNAPTLTQSVDEHGMVLISIAPAAGSTVTADGALINIDVEALAAGDGTLTFDLSNVHVVASDGRPLLLQIEPAKLTVK
ncbi:MAG TPA: secretin N-terminal domain-containing protein [Pyrinomonadaceae bacterium]|nr:secretin N-terminal domain-containing protein [Pyrinomonadaceae bacterium]